MSPILLTARALLCGALVAACGGARALDARREAPAPPSGAGGAARSGAAPTDGGARADAPSEAAADPADVEPLVAWRADSRALLVARGKWAAVVATDGSLVRVDEPRGALLAAAFSPNGELLATVDASGLVVLRAAATGTRVADLPCPAVDAGARANVDRPGVVFSHDGKHLAAWTDHLRVWRVDTRALVCTVLDESPGDGGIDEVAAALDDGTHLILNSDAGARIFDVRKPPKTVPFDPRGATRFFSSPDASVFAGIGEAAVHVWRTATGERIGSTPLR